MANPSALLGVQPSRPQAQPAGPAGPQRSHLHQALAEPVVLPRDETCLLASNTSALGRRAARKHMHAPKALPPPSGLSTFFLKSVFLKQNGRGTEHKMNLPREACSGPVSGGKALCTAATWLLAARPLLRTTTILFPCS